MLLWQEVVLLLVLLRRVLSDSNETTETPAMPDKEMGPEDKGGKGGNKTFESYEEQKKYLEKYWYMGPYSQNPAMEKFENEGDSFKEAVQNFQQMSGLPITDLFWLQKNSTWTVETYKEGIDRRAIENVIDAAFKAWAVFSKHNFTHVDKGDADIIISWRTGEHDCDFTFDGFKGDLSHVIRGPPAQIHFDADEYWAATRTWSWLDDDYNIYEVALHNIGHILGLGHSHAPGSIMQPIYQHYDPPAISCDDENGIYAKYGKNGCCDRNQEGLENFGKVDLDKDAHKELCEIAYAEMQLCSFSGKILVVPEKSDKVFMVEGFGENIKSIKKHSPIFTEVNEKVKFILSESPEVLEGFLRVYSKDKVWRYHYDFSTDALKTSLMQNYPMKANEEIAQFPSDIQAGYTWKHNGLEYFFKGDKYYRRLDNETTMDRGYPKELKSWLGVPQDIRAVFSYIPESRRLHATFFFTADKVLLFDDISLKIDKRFPGSFDNFFGCRRKAPSAGGSKKIGVKNASPASLHLAWELWCLSVCVVVSFRC